MTVKKVTIEDEYDGFAIVVDGKRFRIDGDEGNRKGLIEVFKALGVEDVEYKEVY